MKRRTLLGLLVGLFVMRPFRAQARPQWTPIEWHAPEDAPVGKKVIAKVRLDTPLHRTGRSKNMHTGAEVWNDYYIDYVMTAATKTPDGQWIHHDPGMELPRYRGKVFCWCSL
jgi:hypothetical protein